MVQQKIKRDSFKSKPLKQKLEYAFYLQDLSFVFLYSLRISGLEGIGRAHKTVRLHTTFVSNNVITDNISEY